jgi:hypothetical protein
METLKQFSHRLWRKYILHVLKVCDYDQREVIKVLGVNGATLHRYFSRCSISKLERRKPKTRKFKVVNSNKKRKLKKLDPPKISMRRLKQEELTEGLVLPSFDEKRSTEILELDFYHGIVKHRPTTITNGRYSICRIPLFLERYGVAVVPSVPEQTDFFAILQNRS